MMKIVFSVLLFLFSIVSIALAEVIDVSIKGVDDGRKTSKQQDYKEAWRATRGFTILLFPKWEFMLHLSHESHLGQEVKRFLEQVSIS